MDKKLYKLLKKNRRRCNLAVFTKIFSMFLLIGLIIFSIIVLAARFFKFDTAVYIIAGSVIFLACLIPSALKLHKNRITDSTVASILDKNSSSSGLLLASMEMDLGDWNINSESMPVFKYKWRNDSLKFIYGIAIAALCFLIPVPSIESSIETPLDITGITEEIIHDVNDLKQSGLLTEEEEESILEIIEEIKRNADGLKPSETFESINNLEESIKNLSEQNLNNNKSIAEIMNDIETTMENLSNMSGEADWNSFKEQLSALDNALNGNEELKQEIYEMINELMSSQGLKGNNELSDYFDFSDYAENMSDMNSLTLEALKETLEHAKSSLGENMVQGMRNGNIDPQSLENLELLTEEQINELMGDSTLPGDSGEMILEMLESSKRGGGEGSRDMTNTEKDFNTDKIAELESEILKSDPGEYMGYSYTVPETDIIRDESGGILGLEIEEGGTSRRIYIAPHQRQAAEDYFNRE